MANVADVNATGSFFIQESHSQSMVSGRLNLAIKPNMATQAETIRDQYAGMGTPFGNTITGLQAGINSSYVYEGMGTNIVSNVGADKNDIIDAIAGEIQDPAERALFMTRMGIFQDDTYWNQRRFTTKDEAGAASARSAILVRYGHDAQLGTINEGATPREALIHHLIESMPESAGAGRFNLLRQIENFSQFRGWIDDVMDRNLQPVTPEMLSAAPKLGTNVMMAEGPRGAVQRQHGLHVNAKCNRNHFFIA
jgi:hypothetical protein